jgi:PPOX class probable F420-dependent enzyme
VRELDLAKELGARESGLAVAITSRPDGSPRASVVNAGVLMHPMSGEAVVGFVSRGAVRKLVDLRDRPRATVLFRSGWEWVAVEGDVTLVGPDDDLNGLDEAAVMLLVRTVYAAAVGGTPDEWSHLHETMAAERHTAVLIRPTHVYPTADD